MDLYNPPPHDRPYDLTTSPKRFGDTTALADIDLSINPGELFFLLGPSGCGKSTLLRLIAGLHEPTSGKILFQRPRRHPRWGPTNATP